MRMTLHALVTILTFVSAGSFSVQWITLANVGGFAVKPWLLLLIMAFIINLSLRNFLPFLNVFYAKYKWLLISLLGHQTLLAFFRMHYGDDDSFLPLVKSYFYFLCFVAICWLLYSLPIAMAKAAYYLSLSTFIFVSAAMVYSSSVAGFSLFGEMINLLQGQDVAYFTFVVLKSIFSMTDDIASADTATTLKNTVSASLVVGFVPLMSCMSSSAHKRVVKASMLFMAAAMLVWFLVFMSRAAMLIVAMALMLFVYQYFKANSDRPVALFLSFVACCIGVIFFSVKIKSYFTAIVLDRTSSFEERLGQYDISLDLINQNILIGGASNGLVIHNVPLASWVAGGLSLFLVAVAILAVFAWQAYLTVRAKSNWRDAGGYMPVYEVMFVGLILLRLMTGGGGGYFSADVWFAAAVFCAFQLRRKVGSC